MKKTLLFSAALILCTTLLAQAPQGISHQAVIRNTQGELVTGQSIGIRVSILKGSAEGAAVFVETHDPESNENGLITYVIGNGTNVSGSFEEIDWADGPYFLKTEADPEGGTDYSISGTTQFLSVPYALHAQTSADAFDGDMKQGRIINLGDPVSAKDGATKEYVDVLLARIEALEALAGTTVTDIDGNVYRTVTIGAQVWMAENLRVTKYNNGDAIPTGLSNTEWANNTDGAYAIYDHNETNIDGINSPEEMVAAYGKLYNWYAVIDPRGICPIGWHVPAYGELTQLIDYLVNQGYLNSYYDPNGANNALKSTSTAPDPHPRWDSYATHFGTDDFEFTGLPGGRRNPSGFYGTLGLYGYFWSSTLSSYGGATTFAGVLTLYFDRGSVGLSSYVTELGMSVRCVRN